MSKKCIACGAELEDNARFCDECGVEQKEIIEQNRIQEAKVENTEPKVVRVSSGDKESSWRGFISLILGIISIFAKNSICAGISIFLAVTVLFAKRRKKGAAICGILLSVLALAVIIPGTENDEGDGITEVINDGITDVEQMIYGTPIDLFLETTSAFEIYEQIELKNIEGTVDEYEFATNYEGFAGIGRAEFNDGYTFPGAMQLNLVNWETKDTYDKDVCQELLDKLVNNLTNRYGEYEDVSRSDLKIIQYQWNLDGQAIYAGMSNKSMSKVWVGTSYTHEYYENMHEMVVPDYTQEDTIVKGCSLGNWVGNYVNGNGDILSIDISYATENEAGEDAANVILSNNNDDMLSQLVGYAGQGLYYFGNGDIKNLGFTISSDFQKVSLVQTGHLSHNYSGVYTRVDSQSDIVYEIDFDEILRDCINASDVADRLMDLGYDVSFSVEEDVKTYFIKNGAATWVDGVNGLELYLSSEKYDIFSVYGISTRMSYEDAFKQLESAGAEPLGNGLTLDGLREIYIDEGYGGTIICIKEWQPEEVYVEDVVSEQDLDGAFNFNYTVSDAADVLREKGFIVDMVVADEREEYIVNNGALRWYMQDGKDVLHIEDIGETTFYIWGISPKMTYEDACKQAEILGLEDLGYFEEEGCRGYADWLYEIYIYPKDEGGISIVFKK